jgi:hypothetical protein
MNLFKLIVVFILLLTDLKLFPQPSIDVFSKNINRNIIKLSNIKSRSVWEYRYSKEDDNILADSGWKSYYFGYDNNGRLTEYSKYQVVPELTVKENYVYSKNGNISIATRYNSAGDRIETIEYKYNKSGKLKTEIHTAYLNLVKAGLYFTILANINDDDMFAVLQKELEIDPILESYSITINITDSEELNQYVVIGDESETNSLRFSWGQLSVESQKKLLDYKGPNRKEHTYASKNIQKIQYKYDVNQNLASREVYNTAGDQIEKESWHYNSSNKVTDYYKYNDNGKISSMERYTYDEKGRMSESNGLDPSGRSVSKLVYRYNDYDQLVEKFWYNMKGELNSRFVYSFDNNNNLKEETKFRGENEKESRTEYFYDVNGNITKLIKYDINDKKDKIIKSIYEYY